MDGKGEEPENQEPPDPHQEPQSMEEEQEDQAQQPQPEGGGGGDKEVEQEEATPPPSRPPAIASRPTDENPIAELLPASSNLQPRKRHVPLLGAPQKGAAGVLPAISHKRPGSQESGKPPLPPKKRLVIKGPAKPRILAEGFALLSNILAAIPPIRDNEPRTRYERGESSRGDFLKGVLREKRRTRERKKQPPGKSQDIKIRERPTTTTNPHQLLPYLERLEFHRELQGSLFTAIFDFYQRHLVFPFADEGRLRDFMENWLEIHNEATPLDFVQAVAGIIHRYGFTAWRRGLSEEYARLREDLDRAELWASGNGSANEEKEEEEIILDWDNIPLSQWPPKKKVEDDDFKKRSDIVIRILRAIVEFYADTSVDPVNDIDGTLAVLIESIGYDVRVREEYVPVIENLKESYQRRRAGDQVNDADSLSARLLAIDEVFDMAGALWGSRGIDAGNQIEGGEQWTQVPVNTEAGTDILDWLDDLRTETEQWMEILRAPQPLSVAFPGEQQQPGGMNVDNPDEGMDVDSDHEQHSVGMNVDDPAEGMEADPDHEQQSVGVNVDDPAEGMEADPDPDHEQQPAGMDVDNPDAGVVNDADDEDPEEDPEEDPDLFLLSDDDPDGDPDENP